MSKRQRRYEVRLRRRLKGMEDLKFKMMWREKDGEEGFGFGKIVKLVQLCLVPSFRGQSFLSEFPKGERRKRISSSFNFVYEKVLRICEIFRIRSVI